MSNFLRSILALAIAVSLLSVPFLVVRVGYVVDLIGAKTQIDQLRFDMTNISEAALGDVVGQATAWNQTIRSRQAYNDTWWGDLLIPDDWNHIAMLPMPSNPISSVPASMQERWRTQEMEAMESTAAQYQTSLPQGLTAPYPSVPVSANAAPEVVPVSGPTPERPMAALPETSELESDNATASSGPLMLPAQTVREGTYTVQHGDTLAEIAARFSTSVERLIEWNNLSTDVIVPTQQLIVSPEGTDGRDGHRHNQTGLSNSKIAAH